jgi:multidrug efflux system membrane fusion protein
MKRSYIIAAILAAGAGAWIASGQIADGGGAPETRKPPAELSAADKLPRVRVRRQTAEPRVSEIVLRGRTEAWRTVEVKAETQGRVIDLPVQRGDQVDSGQIIAQLAPEDRPAKLTQAEALLEQRRLEYRVAERLSKKGFRAETELAGAQAALQAAEAAVENAKLALDNTAIRAPYDGFVEERLVDIGDFVEKGDRIAQVVDLDPILVVVQVSERDIDQLEVGAPGRARLVANREVSGKLRFVGAMADPATRTFRVELEVANPERKIPDGVTAEVRIPTERVVAHLVSPAILILTDGGVLGVKTLEADDTVGFHEISILESGPAGMWIAGLPEQVTFITVGQEFVSAGQRVQAVDEETLESDRAQGGTS